MVYNSIFSTFDTTRGETPLTKLSSPEGENSTCPLFPERSVKSEELYIGVLMPQFSPG
jgi:hypothetical protein